MVFARQRMAADHELSELGMNDESPPFNHELATELIGKHVLVGITELRYSGNSLNSARSTSLLRALGSRAYRSVWPTTVNSDCLQIYRRQNREPGLPV